MICGSGGSKSRLAKAAGAEPAGQMRDEKLHAVVARSTLASQMYKTHQLRTTFTSWDVEKVHAVVARSIFLSQNVQSAPAPDHFWQLRCRKSARRCGAKHISKSKMYKTHQLRTTFGSWDVEKVHAVVARSIFLSQNVQSAPAPDHFWQLRCRKSARRCGAKHVSKSKCTKHTNSGPLLAVEMSKKCTPLWREAHFQVKMYKTHHVRTTFGRRDVEKVHAVVARSTFPSQNVQNTTCSRHFLEVQMSFRVAGARDCAPCQKRQKPEGFVAFPRMMAGMGHLKRICKDAFSWQAQYKRHVHERC